MKTLNYSLLLLLLSACTASGGKESTEEIYAAPIEAAYYTEGTQLEEVDEPDPERYRPSEFELAIFQSPSYKRRFAESYLSETETEPPITIEEQETIIRILEYMSEDRYDRAEKQLRRKAGPDSTAVFDMMLASIEQQEENFTEAIELYQIAISKFANFRRAWSKLGEAYMRVGDFKNGAKAFTRSLELGVGNSIEYGLLGYAHFSAGNYIAAESAYRMASLLDPNLIQWKQGLGESFLRQGKFAEAAAFYGSQIQEQPNNADYWLYQAKAYLGLRDSDKVASNLEFVDQLGKSTPLTLNLLGDVYVNKRQYDLASRAYSRAMKLDVNGTPDRAIRAATDLADRGAMFETASLIDDIEEMHTAVLDESQKLKLLRLRARATARDGVTDEQAAILKEIVGLDPLDGEALISLGRYEREKDRKQEAILYFEQAAAIDEFEADAKQAHAELLVAYEQYGEAVPLLSRVYELRPSQFLKDYIDIVQRRSQ